MIIRLHADDNVAIARCDLSKGSMLDSLVVKEDIPTMHKIALADLAVGDPIVKYSQVIGVASRPILAGQHVHDHNCSAEKLRTEYEYCTAASPTPYVPAEERATFRGFRRQDGRVGTRNFIGVLTSVNCSATVARQIADGVTRSGMLEEFGNIDGIASFAHGTGCGMRGSGEGFDNLTRILNGYAQHPNFGGVVIMGLGCEVMQIREFLDNCRLAESDRLRIMTIQDAGGTRKAVEAGIDAIRAMLPRANAAERETVSAEHLTLALQCGGSDALSGVTANPALGRAADILVQHGGTAILSETPELYGAEHLMTRRAVDRAVADALIERIRWWEDYTRANGDELNNNPSPGNKAGGLSTILEKSLGAAAKGGSTNLCGVYRYGERVTSKGLVIMDSPGFDPASVTGQVASGANMVCFTTGRGSALGFKPVPVLKLATNSRVFNAMAEDMDINCGDIVDGTSDIDSKGREIFQAILDVASGKKSKSEELGYGDNEFTPWQIGSVM